MKVYGYYHKRLRGEPTTVEDLVPTVPGNTNPQEWPQCGAWKIKTKSGWAPFQVFATIAGNQSVTDWSDSCSIHGVLAGKTLDDLTLCERWLTGTIEAVSKSDWQHYAEKGVWPGELEQPTIGHNSGAVIDRAPGATIEERAWMASNPVKDEPGANQASNRQDRLRKLREELDEERMALVRPHLDAQREINARYNPIIEDLKACEKELAKHREAWMKAEAEKRRQAAEAAQKAAEAAGVTAQVIIAPIKVGGQVGNRKGLRKVTRYVIKDLGAVLSNESVRNHPDVAAAVLKVATALAKAGAAVPGLETVTEEVA